MERKIIFFGLHYMYLDTLRSIFLWFIQCTELNSYKVLLYYYVCVCVCAVQQKTTSLFNFLITFFNRWCKDRVTSRQCIFRKWNEWANCLYKYNYSFSFWSVEICQNFSFIISFMSEHNNILFITFRWKSTKNCQKQQGTVVFKCWWNELAQKTSLCKNKALQI